MGTTRRQFLVQGLAALAAPVVGAGMGEREKKASDGKDWSVWLEKRLVERWDERQDEPFILGAVGLHACSGLHDFVVSFRGYDGRFLPGPPHDTPHHGAIIVDVPVVLEHPERLDDVPDHFGWFLVVSQGATWEDIGRARARIRDRSSWVMLCSDPLIRDFKAPDRDTRWTAMPVMRCVDFLGHMVPHPLLWPEMRRRSHGRLITIGELFQGTLDDPMLRHYADGSDDPEHPSYTFDHPFRPPAEAPMTVSEVLYHFSVSDHPTGELTEVVEGYMDRLHRVYRNGPGAPAPAVTTLKTVRFHEFPPGIPRDPVSFGLDAHWELLQVVIWEGSCPHAT